MSPERADVMIMSLVKMAASRPVRVASDRARAIFLSGILPDSDDEGMMPEEEEDELDQELVGLFSTSDNFTRLHFTIPVSIIAHPHNSRYVINTDNTQQSRLL